MKNCFYKHLQYMPQYIIYYATQADTHNYVATYVQNQQNIPTIVITYFPNLRTSNRHAMYLSKLT